MSKVNLDPKFDNQFPEDYQWELVDSIKLCKLACGLRDRIKSELKEPPAQRINVPGLRVALNVISEMTEV